MLEALLIGLIAFVGVFDFAIGTLYFGRPICLGPLVGLALGDVQQGLVIGATLELFFIGSVSVGGYIPPDVVRGSVLATAFAIKGGIETEAAIALALPIALLVLALNNGLQCLFPFISKIGDRAAERGEERGINITYWITGLCKCFVRALLVFVAYLFGSDIVAGIVAGIPQFIIDGMAAATGFLPALGFAMLIKMIIAKDNILYYFIGFLLAAYFGVPTLGVALLALLFVMLKFDLLNLNTDKAKAVQEVTDDDEF